MDVTSAERKARISVSDTLMRKTLIQIAKNMEVKYKEGTLTNKSSIRGETQTGMVVDGTITSPGPDKPLIIIMEYKINSHKFKKWLKDNQYLLEGPASFVLKGIETVIPFGSQKWDKVGFSIRDKNGEPIWLHLFNENAKFIIHRGVTNNHEWEIYLEA